MISPRHCLTKVLCIFILIIIFFIRFTWLFCMSSAVPAVSLLLAGAVRLLTFFFLLAVLYVIQYTLDSITHKCNIINNSAYWGKVRDKIICTFPKYKLCKVAIDCSGIFLHYKNILQFLQTFISPHFQKQIAIFFQTDFTRLMHYFLEQAVSHFNLAHSIFQDENNYFFTITHYVSSNQKNLGLCGL